MALGVSLRAISLWGLSVSIAAAATCEPVLDWALSPLLPGDTALVTGSCLGDSTLQACLLLNESTPCFELASVQQWDGSIKATLPPTVALGPLRLTAVAASGSVSASLVVNDPVVDWWVTNAWRSPGVVFPGGEITFFGKALAYSEIVSASLSIDCLPQPPLFSDLPPLLPAPALGITLVSVSSGLSYPLAVRSASCYRVFASVPPLIPDGAYTVYMHNGLRPVGTAASLSNSTPLVVVDSSEEPLWPARLWVVGVNCSVSLIGDCLAAAGASGGGTVGVPPGFYRMPPLTMLGLLDNVTLTGLSPEARDTTLAWLDEPPDGSQCVSNNSYWCACIFTQNAYWDPTASLLQGLLWPELRLWHRHVAHLGDLYSGYERGSLL